MPDPAHRTDESPAWRLAPGVRVVRRGRDRLQVGLHPERRVVAADDATTHALLMALRQQRPLPTSPAAASVLDALLRARLVVPAPAGRATGPRVAVVGATSDWPVDVPALLRAGGARVGNEADADAVLLLGALEPDRDRIDPLLRKHVTHLPVSLTDGGARCGPLVVPGRTACLRCVDLHHVADDPDHLAVLTRYCAAQRRAAAGAPPTASGDLALATLVTSWAVRDLLGHLADPGARPSTWSATLTWWPGVDGPRHRRWLRHPGCGCGWAAYADEPREVSGTMEA